MHINLFYIIIYFLFTFILSTVPRIRTVNAIRVCYTLRAARSAACACNAPGKLKPARKLVSRSSYSHSCSNTYTKAITLKRNK